MTASNSLDYEGSEQDYSMDVTVKDRASGGLTDKIDVKVLVTNVNEPPVITGEAMPEFNENGTGRIGRYRATDPERDSFTWSLAGSEAGNFSIDSNGYLSFSVTPDFEDKSSYFVSVVAADGESLPGSLDVFVTILDVDEPPEIAGVYTLEFAENTGTTTVLETYGATDPESQPKTYTWSLAGRDSGDFDISNTGQLTFKNAPDYDSPADSGRNNEYNVQVRANDGSLTGGLDVTVSVTDVNEAPSVPTGNSSITVPENTTSNLARYRSTDPDKDDTVMWDVSGSDSDDFRIDSSGNLAFDGAPDYDIPDDSGGNNVYDVNVVATDGNLTASFAVTVTVTPVDEPPVVTGTTTIDDYDENGTGDVADYGANDPETAGNNNDDQVTWSLAGPDREDFDISNSGVLTFKNAPDYDGPVDSGGDNQYEVIIHATDSTNKRGELDVDVIVKNVDELPEITGPDTVDDFPENSSTSRQVGLYTASDPEGATVTLGLSSEDTDFNLASNGAVTFEESPDYEDQSTYTFTVRAVAGSDTVNKPVTVNIQNLEEPGTVTLSSVQPQEDILLTATLEDGDGANGIRWQWYRASSQSSTGTALAGATSTSYTPISDDVGNYLRVVATYDDPHGDDETAVAVSVNRVLAVNPDNVPPEFPTDGDYSRSIRKNTRAGTNLGAPVRATDANNDRLTYSIPPSDYFEINQSTGQLRTKVMLDHELDDEHTVIVTAADPGDLRSSVDVTITVEDVDETPVISGPSMVDFAEGAAGTVATYTATDPDDKGIDWMLTGSDDDAFTLSSGGVLTFNAVPDFETKSQYRTTIEAREQSPGTSVARVSVTIRITNVDEDGMVAVPVSEPRVGQQLTPTVEDPDGGVGSIEWKWESRESGGDWTSIPGATSRSYTPTRDDNGKNLRVTAIYRDRQGPGKTYTHEFTSAVALRPYFPTDTDMREVRENTEENEPVGSRFTARHPDNVNLTYTVGGADAIYFTIDSTSGQLKTSTIALDYEISPGPEAEVEITARAPDNETATIVVTVNLTNECTSADEPPCAPGRPGVSSAFDTSLRITWFTPRIPPGEAVTGYELHYRELDTDDSWTQQLPGGTDRSHIIENLTKGTEYEVQVRASNGNGTGEWSQSGTGTSGYVPPPPPPPPPDPEPVPPTTTTTTTGGGGGGGGGFVGGGFLPPAPPRPPVASRLQTAVVLFQPLVSNGSLVRVWRLVPRFQRWLFYDPAPRLSPFYTLRSVNLDPDSPTIVAINVTRPQRFRGYALQRGWNYIPITPEPPSPSGPPNVQPVGQLFQPLIANGNLGRIWWLDSATQEWNFYDPRPEFASFNSLKEIDLSANPPVVLVVSVLRGQRFRGQSLYRGWNYIVLR